MGASSREEKLYGDISMRFYDDDEEFDEEYDMFNAYDDDIADEEVIIYEDDEDKINDKADRDEIGRLIKKKMTHTFRNTRRQIQ